MGQYSGSSPVKLKFSMTKLINPHNRTISDCRLLPRLRVLHGPRELQRLDPVGLPLLLVSRHNDKTFQLRVLGAKDEEGRLLCSCKK